MSAKLYHTILKYCFGIFLVQMVIEPSYAQINLSSCIDSINQIGKEIENYDFYPEKEHKKYISLYCNKEELTVVETIGLYSMPSTTTIYKMAFKDISLRYPHSIQSHNYKEVFKWIKVDENGSDTFLNTYTDMVYLNWLPGFQPKEIAAQHHRLSQILGRNILYLAYSKTLGKISQGQLDSIYVVLRDDQKIKLDFSKYLGGMPLLQLDALPKLNQSTEISDVINTTIMNKLGTDLNKEDIALPLDIYFQITPGGNATNIYTNRKVFWYYDFLDDQKNRFEIMNQMGNASLFTPLKTNIGFTDINTLHAITDLIQNLKFTPGVVNNKNVATVHKISLWGG